MINLTQLCYMFLAPLSVTSEFILIFGFWKLKQFKDHPEVMIFWQCLSQIILDVHWFTGIETIKSTFTDEECLFLGAFSVYFYYLSWDYSLLLSIEILLKILNPHKTGYKARRFWYHAIAHLTSMSIFISLMVSKTNGNSIMKTCFVQENSVYELLILLPALIHFPLCAGIIGYTLYISHNTYFAPYLKYHMLVVATYAASWVPIALVHGLSYSYFEVTVPIWFIYVCHYLDCCLFGWSFRVFCLPCKNVAKRPVSQDNVFDFLSKFGKSIINIEIPNGSVECT